jgi:predicted DCC family thiol-disulfide oxidoreductase YuxK
MKLSACEAYSYRQDNAVPEFEDAGPIVFMDGNCVLCTRGARLIARLDHAGEFRICPIQTVLGQSILRHYGIAPDNPESWLYLVDGRAYTSLDAIVRAGARMGGWGRLVSPFGLLPRAVQDWLYGRVARNRYALFGRTDMCAVPDPRLRKRLMS